MLSINPLPCNTPQTKSGAEYLNLILMWYVTHIQVIRSIADITWSALHFLYTHLTALDGLQIYSVKIYLNRRILVRRSTMVARLKVWWHTPASIHSHCVAQLHELAEQQENGTGKRQDAVSVLVGLIFGQKWYFRFSGSCYLVGFCCFSCDVCLLIFPTFHSSLLQSFINLFGLPSFLRPLVPSFLLPFVPSSLPSIVLSFLRFFLFLVRRATKVPFYSPFLIS